MAFSNQASVMLLSHVTLYYLHDTPHYLKVLTTNLSTCLFTCLSFSVLECKLPKIRNDVGLIYPVPHMELVIYRNSTTISRVNE